MSEEKEQLDQELLDAIKLLRNAVKDSHLENQKHIDLTIPMASELPRYEKALGLVNAYVSAGKLENEDLKRRLGLI